MEALIRFRESRGWTLAQAARAVGLTSKGYYSVLERGRARMPIRIAIKIEEVSNGEVRADEIVAAKDRELLKAIRGRPSEPEGRAA